MKALLITILSISSVCVSQAALEKKEEQVNPERSDALRDVWYRNGKKIMQQQLVNNATGLSMCSISSREENKWALVVKFTKKRISSIATTPIFDKDYRYSLDDFTRDGIPDMIQVMEVIEGELKYHEAFSIISGTVEPIPDELMKGRTDEFYYDDEVVAYLKSKLEPVDPANASNAASVNLNQSARIR